MDQPLDSILKLIEGALNKIKDFFSDRFKDDKEMEELAVFLKDQTNLYNPDGTITDEYKAWIEKIEVKIGENGLDQILIDSASSPQEKEAIKSIVNLVDEREALMKDYRKTILDFDNDADAWVKERVTEGLDKKKKAERIKQMENVLSSDDDIIE